MLWIWAAIALLLDAMKPAIESAICLYASFGSTAPVRIEAIPPIYPVDAIDQEIQGRVLVEFSLRSDGTVETANAIAHEPSDAFDSAALAAVRQWRYCPMEDPPTEPLRTSVVFKLAP